MASTTGDDIAQVEDGSLQPLAEPGKVMDAVTKQINRLDVNEDWQTVEQSLNFLRSLVRFHTAIFSESITPNTFKYLLMHSDSLRSAIARVALNAYEDIFIYWPDVISLDESFNINATITLLTIKSVNERKFIAEAARYALMALAKAPKSSDASKGVIFGLLDAAVKSKNVRLIAVATSGASIGLEAAASSISLTDGEVASILKSAAEIESGKSVEARPPAQVIIRTISRLFDETVLTKAIASLALAPVAVKRVEDIVRTTAAPSKPKSLGSDEWTKPWMRGKEKSALLSRSDASGKEN